MFILLSGLKTFLPVELSVFQQWEMLWSVPEGLCMDWGLFLIYSIQEFELGLKPLWKTFPYIIILHHIGTVTGRSCHLTDNLGVLWFQLRDLFILKCQFWMKLKFWEHGGSFSAGTDVTLCFSLQDSRNLIFQNLYSSMFLSSCCIRASSGDGSTSCGLDPPGGGSLDLHTPRCSYTSKLLSHFFSFNLYLYDTC